jgi:Lrp/AsnC family leucine-responsive transcriptional regulator
LTKSVNFAKNFQKMNKYCEMRSKLEIQNTDKPLLNTLQNDGRISNQELAEAAGMSASACWRRVKALEDKGVIEGYSTLLNAKACGLNFHAIVHVMMVRHQSQNVKAFIEAVMTRPEVLDCFATTGDADYHLRVRCSDQDAYNTFLEEFLFNLTGVSNVKTSVVLRQVKHQTQLAL